MVDDDQPTAWIHRLRGGPQHACAVQGERCVQVLRVNQVEGPGGEVFSEVDAERGDGRADSARPLLERAHG